LRTWPFLEIAHCSGIVKLEESFYSVVLAGGGVRPGIVHGRSDRHAAIPIDGAVSLQDLVTTIRHCLGSTRDTELTDTFGRPLRLCQGEPLRAVLS
jgi:hypothetical protein